jgi:hypothetical protein
MTTKNMDAAAGNVLTLAKPDVQKPIAMNARRVRRERLADGFFKLENDICDLQRAADLALRVYQDECPDADRANQRSWLNRCAGIGNASRKGERSASVVLRALQ